MTRRIDYYFSLVSPWAYIGHAAFRAAIAPFGITVIHKPTPLGELFAETGGLPLGKRHPARQRYRMMELQRWRDRRGLAFHLQPKHWPFAAQRADGLVIAAQAAGHDVDAFLRLAFPAVWEQQRDLGDEATLVALADKAGLPGAQLLARAADADTAATYEQNRLDAIDAGVFGAPAYVRDGEVFWGQDRIDLLVDALASGRASYAPQP